MDYERSRSPTHRSKISNANDSNNDSKVYVCFLPQDVPFSFKHRSMAMNSRMFSLRSEKSKVAKSERKMMASPLPTSSISKPVMPNKPSRD